MILISNQKKGVKEQLRKKYVRLTRSIIKLGISVDDLDLQYTYQFKAKANKDNIVSTTSLYILLTATFIGFYILLVIPLEYIWYTLFDTTCLIPNNYLIWEATRPISDCKFCNGVANPLIFNNISREDFEEYAYSSRPMIIKHAVEHWPAKKNLNFSKLKQLFTDIEGALDDKHGPCQFLHFKSEFISLRDVFEMPEARAEMKAGSKAWYVGWSNCDPRVLSKLRLHYPLPHFLPSDAEMPNAEYLFIGYDQGAIMHIDYVPRLMWQAQLRGHKHWSLAPTPECDDICMGMEFDVEPGDAVLVDTRIWYHGTRIRSGDFSVTVQSEYG